MTPSGDNNQTDRLTLAQVVRMLRDKGGWRLVGNTPSYGVFDDEATYCDTGVYTYLDCGGVTFRRYGDPKYGGTIVYEANPLAYIVTTIYTAILRRYLKRKRKQAAA